MTVLTLPPVTHWINGTSVRGSEASTNVVNPATGQALGSVPLGSPSQVDAAVHAARAALPSWMSTPVAERADIVRRISEGIARRAEEIAQVVTSEMGSPITFSRRVQAGVPASVASSFADLALDYEWEEVLGNSVVVREPIGVVGAITPWNYPLHQIVAKVVPAIVGGNTVVLKPSELAPFTAGILMEIANEAGLPIGVLNVVHGEGSVVGEAMTTHPDIDMISFTGSTVAGRRVAAAGAGTVKRVALELGGKSANVILDDADFTLALKAGLGAAWQNGGQTCTALTRMLVPASRHEELIDELVAIAEGFTVGDPTLDSTRIGPMVSLSQRQRVHSYIERGVAEGARLVFGGPGEVPGVDVGTYVRPTIFADVDPNATIAQEEIFGPVLSVIPYSDEEAAISIANNSIYGLAGAVYGAPDHADAVARRLRTGLVIVNAGRVNMLAPFGGYKQSGNGRELGRFGLDEFLEVKSLQH
jgi:aldehyde dehydrogenase (NAD+)